MMMTQRDSLDFNKNSFFFKLCGMHEVKHIEWNRLRIPNL